MSLQKIFKNMSADSKKLLASRAIGWGSPVVMIPALRYMQDKDKDPSLRKELFTRDFSSYFIGTGVYFASLATSANVVSKAKAFKNMSQMKKILLPEVVAAVSYCLFSGILGPKLSKKLNKNRKSEIKKLDIVEPQIEVQTVNKPLKNDSTQPNLNASVPDKTQIHSKDVDFARKVKVITPPKSHPSVFSGFKI